MFKKIISKSLLSISLILFNCLIVYTQNKNVGIGTLLPNQSALLELESSNQGLLFPRLTTLQRNSITSPAHSLIIYNLTTDCIEIYNNKTSKWVSLGCIGCQLTGNFSIFPTNNITSSSFEANWTMSDNATTYLLEVSTDSAFNTYLTGYNKLNISKINNYTITGLKCDSIYYYRVISSNDCDSSISKISKVIMPKSPITSNITGDTLVCKNQKSVVYSVINEVGVTYNWNYSGTGLTILSGQGTNTILVDFSSNSNSETISVTPSNSCGNGNTKNIIVNIKPSTSLSSPVSNNHIATSTKIEWKWNSVNGAKGYKYNTVNNYNTSTDIGNDTTLIQNNLTCNSVHILYVWTYNDCDTSLVTILNQSTSLCGIVCGNQEFTATNLNVGTMINSTTGGQQQLNNGIVEKYCYNNDPANCLIYGGLYEWGEMMNYASSANCDPCSPSTGKGGVQGICPSGYHIPSDLEMSRWEWCVENTIAPTGVTLLSTFQNDTTYRGDSNLSIGVANKMKSNNPSWDGSNSTGFSALAAGNRSYAGGTFHNLTTGTYYWTSTERSSGDAWYRYLETAINQVFRYSYNINGKQNGFSVRCLKD